MHRRNELNVTLQKTIVYSDKRKQLLCILVLAGARLLVHVHSAASLVVKLTITILCAFNPIQIISCV